MYGCPKCAWLLHWEDPLMACPASSSPESISFGDWYHHEQQTVAPADELKNRCLLSPFNHTAASPRYYATSKLVASVEELQATINTARRDGQVVRVVGAGWSDRDHFAANNRTMYISLVGPKLQGYQKLEEVGPQERPLVVAGAGIFIGGQQWLSGSLQVQWEDSLVHKLWLDGLALTSIPDAIGMTLGGLLSTGSDGWSFIDDMDSAGTPFEGSSNTISSSVWAFGTLMGWANSGKLEEFN
ncbi:expressed unknown protein [Seminavis robusta]|uniref:Uncharacterized protein n=1 Tax=Seminavis robusta TaxID=568900 RepID=A0A9N8DSZ7_9STRA|nr:expressed unknown protein [Seminavis robusta]|eukprot:Sro259_g101370.1 n/a (242) ;mRNA; f:46903-47628